MDQSDRHVQPLPDAVLLFIVALVITCVCLTNIYDSYRHDIQLLLKTFIVKIVLCSEIHLML